MENKEKNVKKNTRSTKKKISKLNETVSDVVVKNNNDDLQVCKNCGYLFDKGMSVCPKCRKRCNSNYNLLYFIIFGIVFLFIILLVHFIDKYVVNEQSYDSYVAGCSEVTYENLVRVPKNYLGDDVIVLGSVSHVEGVSDGFSNNMEITLDLNLFDDGSIENVTVYFEDDSYEYGFMNGDIIKVYGEYETINGNIPYINAKYIEIVK